MSSRKYDFVILGATGFTGQFVAEEVSFYLNLICPLLITPSWSMERENNLIHN